MSDPLGSSATQHNDNDDNDESDSGKVTVRHGELGIGFNAFQERYVSTVTSQAPWTVKAVSYDSKLFKELSTTWKFTPNVPKSTTLEAGLDQEVKERKLLIRTKSTPALQELDVDDVSQYGTTTTTTTTTSPASDPASEKVGSLSQGQPAQQLQSRQPRHFFTAAAVFGASALPYPTSNFESLSSPGDSSRPSSQNYPSGQRRTTSPSEHSPPQSSTLSPTPMPTRTLMTTPKTCTPEHDSQARTSSPSNLGTMKPCDYPSVWVDFEIEFEFASPVHASMSSMFFDQVSKEMLSAFIQRAQVLYGPR
ncbi:hypothetical protein BG004_004589 [Podila humilis]|nr:hypothetical protein BG004_004589 [Podila humilis]